MNFWGGGVLLYNDQYANVTNNSMQNVRIGVQTGNYHDPNTNSLFQNISNNTDTDTPPVAFSTTCTQATRLLGLCPATRLQVWQMPMKLRHGKAF